MLFAEAVFGTAAAFIVAKRKLGEGTIILLSNVVLSSRMLKDVKYALIYYLWVDRTVMLLRSGNAPGFFDIRNEQSAMNSLVMTEQVF